MNPHLNLFHFFDGRDKQYIEDNLSRAFSLCLKHDGMFLENVVREVLPTEVYEQNFSIDHPDQMLEINLQVRASDLGGFQRVIAVACSGTNVASFKGIEPSATDDPITDVCLKLNETCIIFEFKRTGENCAAQLLGQAEAIKVACGGDAVITTVDLCWPKIIKIALRVLSIQKQMSSENLFTKDFTAFLELRHPEWFPVRCLKSIPFPASDDDPNHHYLQSRLKQIVNQVCTSDEDVVETGGRYAIGVDFGWASEVRVWPSSYDETKKDLLIQIWPGDTKRQGWSLYKQDRLVRWSDKVAGYELGVDPYLKFSHFNRGTCWIFPTPAQAAATHSYDFFVHSTGRWKEVKWEEFDETLSAIIPGWKQERDWGGRTFEDCFEQSDRSYFDVSAGFALTVKIPYQDAQNLDVDLNTSSLHQKIRSVVEGFRGCLDLVEVPNPTQTEIES